jgi:hypothetical protein
LLKSCQWGEAMYYVSELQPPTGLLFIPQMIYEYGQPLRRLAAGLSPRSPGSISAGFEVDTIALGEVFLRVHRSSPVSIILLSFSMLIYDLEDQQNVR